MNPLERLSELEDNWHTEMGAWFGGERVVYRGEDLLGSLLPEMDWMALYLFGITGRRFSADELRALNAIWTNTSYPEPRLWNNRITSLAGTVRSTASLTLGVATAVSEARIYGHGANIRAIDFQLRARERVKAGESLLAVAEEEFAVRRSIYGYGRPIPVEDERNAPMLKLMAECGLDQGEHVRQALELEQLLFEKYQGRRRRLVMLNITGLDAALAADLGFTPRQFHLFMTTCFLAGMPPCYIDAFEREPGSFFPLRVDRIKYEGPVRRRWKD